MLENRLVTINQKFSAKLFCSFEVLRYLKHLQLLSMLRIQYLYFQYILQWLINVYVGYLNVANTTHTQKHPITHFVTQYQQANHFVACVIEVIKTRINPHSIFDYRLVSGRRSFPRRRHSRESLHEIQTSSSGRATWQWIAAIVTHVTEKYRFPVQNSLAPSRARIEFICATAPATGNEGCWSLLSNSHERTRQQ